MFTYLSFSERHLSLDLSPRIFTYCYILLYIRFVEIIDEISDAICIIFYIYYLYQN